MNRLLIATGAVTMLVVVACGSSSAAGVSTSTSSGASGGGAAGRNGTAGELVQINGNTLILNTQSGDVTVQTTSATTVQKTSTGSVADIVVGTCIGATGSKDASGAVTANSVRLSEKVGGTCNGGAFGGAPGGGGGGRGNGGADTRTPPAGAAQPTPPANFASLRGEVSAVSGTSVSVLSSTGVATTITVPTTVAVTRSATASLSDLSTGQCVLATGSKDSSGVVAARSLSIVPAGPSGCFTGRGGFRRGGGGAGGGAGGGGAGSSGSASVGA
ncbi:MAG TPA: hypothetical protein VG266_00160 [Candidatus Dormibacteraeota bacterium]|jgi:hypothetical protein|nr:hypothetical protein [Candidatus Dormibacteraeota bacterium]